MNEKNEIANVKPTTMDRMRVDAIARMEKIIDAHVVATSLLRQEFMRGAFTPRKMLETLVTMSASYAAKMRVQRKGLD
jgi:hypothetical protein